MLIILKENAQAADIACLQEWLAGAGATIEDIALEGRHMLALRGECAKLDVDFLMSQKAVQDVKRLHAPYEKASREKHSADSVLDIGGVRLGGGHFQIIGGPCTVESEAQIMEIAQSVKAAGAGLLRGGAFKPRTSPYAFQGLGEEGLRLLIKAGRETGLPVVSEIMEEAQLPLFDEVQVIQVGARNMQNYELLKVLGRTDKPILLKRSISATLEQLLMSAEYILAGGNERVILCERGVRAVPGATRSTLDLSAVPLLKRMTHLPVIVDPSHATGLSELVLPMSLAATAAGADGLLIEVHGEPCCALCDGRQSVTPAAFASLCEAVRHIKPFSYKRGMES